MYKPVADYKKPQMVWGTRRKNKDLGFMGGLKTAEYCYFLGCKLIGRYIYSTIKRDWLVVLAILVVFVVNIYD